MSDHIITIKKGNLKATCKRNELINCSETADGMVFQFKNGIMIQVVDQNLQSGMKNLIKNSVDRMIKGNLDIDFDNRSNPVSFLAD